jgi:hypothetical protein
MESDLPGFPSLPRICGTSELRGADDHGLVNFSHDANGAYLCMDDAGRIVETPHGSDEFLVLATNIESFFTRITDALEAGQIGEDTGADYLSVMGANRRVVIPPHRNEAELGTGNVRIWSIQANKPMPPDLSLSVIENGKTKKTWTLAPHIPRPQLNPFTKKVGPPRTDVVHFPKLKPMRLTAARVRLTPQLPFSVWLSFEMVDEIEVWPPG